MGKKKVLVYLLSISLVVCLISGYFYYDYSQGEIKELKSANSELKSNLNLKKQEINQLQTNLTQTRSDLNQTLIKKEELEAEVENLTLQIDSLEAELSDLVAENQRLEREVRLSKPLEKGYYLLATSDGGGEVLNLSAEVETGDGEVSVTINQVTFENNTQLSIKDAWDTAGSYTGVDLSSFDGELKVEHDYEGHLAVRGDSGGAAFSLVIIAALQNKTIDENILVTGSIQPDGDIGPVGKVEEKVRAAEEELGAEKVLVPEGEKVSVSGIEVGEVSDISEAATIVLS